MQALVRSVLLAEFLIHAVLACFEYDSLSGNYAEFLLTDIFPEVEKEYRITDNPELRAICRNSCGGIFAFGVA